MWPHTLTVLGAVGMAWAADRDRWWLVGLFGGVALWGRLHAGIICALLVLAVAWVRRDVRPAVQAGVAGLVMLAIACGWNRWYYGTWDPTAGYVTSVFTDYAGSHVVDLQNQLGMWISPERGILTWTPLVLVLSGGLVRSWRVLPDWSRYLFLAGVAYTLVQAYFNRFSGGSTFYPYRLGLEFVACATPALALSAERMGRTARLLFTPVAVAQGVAIAIGALDLFWMTGVDLTKPRWLFQLAVVAVLAAGWLAGRHLAGRRADLWDRPGKVAERNGYLPAPSGSQALEGPV
jgi:alpha-1,2-mannosyltransferase